MTTPSSSRRSVTVQRLAEWIRSMDGSCPPVQKRVPTGWPQVDEQIGGLAGGAIHEWILDLASRSTRWAAPLCLLAHLGEQALTAATTSAWVVWIGRRCWAHGGVLTTRGRLMVRSIFVDPPDQRTRVWAADLALRCPAVAAVVSDASGLDMASTRRLQLAARSPREEEGAKGGAIGLLTRPPWEIKALSASTTRWLVRPVPPPDLDRRTTGEIPGDESQGNFGPDSGESGGGENSESGGPRWSVELLRCKGVQPSLRTPRVWAVEWDREKGAVSLSPDVVGGSGQTPPVESPAVRQTA